MTGRVLVFDSGVGGLSVAREIRALLPAAEMVYVADDAAFPYGNWEDGPLTDHVVSLIGDLIARHEPDAVVVACNTASTLVLPPLRTRHSLPFVGTVPAIKPAAERTHTKLISVLATPGTVRRDYTRALIAEFAGDCHVEVVGSALLAPLAEAYMRGEPVAEADVFQEIAPAFVEQEGRRTDTVVLGCTHFPFLRDQLERVAPWPVEWTDPAPAIARRVLTVMRGLDLPLRDAPPGKARLTSGHEWPEAIRPFLRSLGLEPEAAAGSSVRRSGLPPARNEP